MKIAIGVLIMNKGGSCSMASGGGAGIEFWHYF